MKWPEIVLFPLFCALVAEEYCDSHQPGPEHKLQFSRVADKKYTVVVPYFMEKKKSTDISCTLPQLSSLISTENKAFKNNMETHFSALPFQIQK